MEQYETNLFPCKVCGEGVLVAGTNSEDVYCGPCYYEYIEPYEENDDEFDFDY